MKGADEMTNLTYRKSGDYLIPNIQIKEISKPIGRYGRMRRKYLQEENPILYNDLIITENLFPHLLAVDEIARNRFNVLMEQMKIQRNVTEHMKRQNPMLWVGEMNNIRACVDEIIIKEIICE